MPARVRHTRRAYSTLGTAAFAAAAVASTIALPPLALAWKAFAVGSVGAFLASDRVGRNKFERRVRLLAKGDAPLVDLPEHANGELLVVQGRVEADELLHGILHNTPGVYRRTVLGKWIDEAAVNFVLVSESGKQTPVHVAGARWLRDFREPMEYPRSLFLRDEVPDKVKMIVNASRGENIRGAEAVLKVGTMVQVVGYKNVAPDPEGRFVGFRQPPERAILQSGPNLPLVISELT